MKKRAPTKRLASHWLSLDRAAFAVLLACVVWAPLPLGSNRPWALALLAMVLWLAVCLRVADGSKVSVQRGGVNGAVPLGLVGGFALLVALQASGLARGLGFISIDPFQSRYHLFAALVYLAAVVLVMTCVQTVDRAKKLLMAVVAAGVLQAVISVALFSGGASYQFLFDDFSQGSRATGTFPNPDHLAGFLELCLSAGLGLLLAQFGVNDNPSQGWRQKTLDVLAFLMSGKMLLRLLLVAMVVAMVLTRSRMGNGAFFLALLMVGCLVAIVSKRMRKPAIWLVVSMLVVDMIVVGQWVGLDRVVERLRDTAEATTGQSEALASGIAAPAYKEESLQDRARVPKLSLPLIAQAPWFGHGGGTYYLALPSIKPTGFPHHWSHAHNDYVEVAVDTGLVGLSLWMIFCAATAWKAARLLRDSEPRLKRGVGVSALMALCCMGLHSLVDFNLQIPANAMTLVVLLALVWAMPATGRAQAAAPANKHGEHSRRRQDFEYP